MTEEGAVRAGKVDSIEAYEHQAEELKAEINAKVTEIERKQEEIEREAQVISPSSIDIAYLDALPTCDWDIVPRTMPTRLELRVPRTVHKVDLQCVLNVYLGLGFLPG